MKRLIIISDLHLGVNRTGGTTPASLSALREYGHEQHRKLLDLADDGDTVLVNGDLVDTHAPPLSETLRIYTDACDFLDRKPSCRLVYGLGNHDISKNSAVLGAVEFLGALLGARYPERFTLVEGGKSISNDTYILSHVPNQSLFELELSRVPEGVKWLFLHCNFDNEHAVMSDASLNLSRAQAHALKARGITCIFGHEHQQRQALGGAVVLVGNNFASSIADCLGNNSKRCAVIEDGVLSFIETWNRDTPGAAFIEADWRDTARLAGTDAKFIRIGGAAPAYEAAAVVKAISGLRTSSQAFVITNAVRIEQAEGLESIADSVEDVRNVSVVDLLLEILTTEQQTTVKRLLGRTKETT